MTCLRELSGTESVVTTIVSETKTQKKCMDWRVTQAEGTHFLNDWGCEGKGGGGDGLGSW